MPVPIRSESIFSPGIFDIGGTAQIATMSESFGVGGLPLPDGNLVVNNLVMTDQDTRFRFEWGVTGSFVHVVNPVFEWRITLYLEQYGPGEFDLQAAGVPTRVVPWNTGDLVLLNQINFPGAGVPNSTTITIPGNTVPPGLYDVVAVIQLYDMPSGLPCFAAAFAEFNKINFYKEH